MPLPKAKTQKETNYLKHTALWIGVPKIGKSTIAGGMGDETNKVLFFPTEPGLRFQEVYKWQTQETISETNVETGEIVETTIDRDPQNWVHFAMCVDEMVKQNDFKVLVIDTVDNLFSWCQDYVRKQKKIEHEKDVPFGAGYEFVKNEFHKHISKLAQRGYGIIFISHSKTSEVEDRGRKFSYIDSSLPNGAKKVVHPLCDYIFYFHLDDNGNRVIRTKGTPGINAGDRSGRLPEIIPMNAEILISELSKS